MHSLRRRGGLATLEGVPGVLADAAGLLGGRDDDFSLSLALHAVLDGFDGLLACLGAVIAGRESHGESLLL